jgi:hypothetical protein
MPHNIRFGLGSTTVKEVLGPDSKGTYLGLVLGYHHAADNSFYFNANFDLSAGKTKLKTTNEISTVLWKGDIDAGYRFGIPGIKLSLTPFLGRKYLTLATKFDALIASQKITLRTEAWKLGGNIAYQVIDPLSLGFEAYYAIPDTNKVSTETNALGESTSEKTTLKNTSFFAWAFPIKYALSERWELEGRYGQFQRTLQEKEETDKATQKFSEISFTFGYRF